MDFIIKVKAMKASEIVQTMIDGLEHPVIKVNMNTFGGYESNGICVGCAATNFLCKASGVTFNIYNIIDVVERSKALHADWEFVDRFESAINNLRLGSIILYNSFADIINIAKIPIDYKGKLPKLETNNYRDRLKYYQDLADWLSDQGL